MMKNPKSNFSVDRGNKSSYEQSVNNINLSMVIFIVTDIRLSH